MAKISAKSSVTKPSSKAHSFQLVRSNPTTKPPQAWLVINVILTSLASIFLMLTILAKFTNISHTSPILAILSPVISIFLRLFASIANLISPGITVITVLVILIMNPICALGYLIENRQEKLPFSIKNLVFATLPLPLSILVIIIL